MEYTILTWPRERYNDSLSSARSRSRSGGDKVGTFDTEEDGYPVVIMESGVKSFEDGAKYHEKRQICHQPAKTWEEALEVAGKFYEEDGDKLYEDSPVHGSLQAGDPDYWAVEVLHLMNEE